MSLTVRIYPSRIILIIKESISLEKTTHNLCFFFHFLLGHMINLVFFFLPFIFFGHKKNCDAFVYLYFIFVTHNGNQFDFMKEKKDAHVFLGSFGFFFSFFFQFMPIKFFQMLWIDWLIYLLQFDLHRISNWKFTSS